MLGLASLEEACLRFFQPILSNQKVKISKTITHAFLHIYLPSPHDYDVEVPNFTFCVGGERKAPTLFSFP